tara:strand:+ start:3466 stop:3750 length:285 start_codon:yes stop_codon:yes gene_type:complete
MGRNIAHTPGGTVDGAKGANNKMERGGSVSANPIWTPGGPQSPKQRMVAGRYAGQDGDYGKSVSQRMTPKNQHGTSGSVEHVGKQPNLRGSDAG